MIFPNPYWSTKLKITALQRWILVHSIRYYEMDSPLVSDKMFDDNCKQLVEMQKEFREEAKKSRYWSVFKDFEGSTGFYLVSRLNKKDKDQLFEIARGLRDVNGKTGFGRYVR